MNKDQGAHPSRSNWATALKRFGAITFALGALVTLMVQAGISTGCRSSAPGASGDSTVSTATPGEPAGAVNAGAPSREGPGAAPSGSADDEEMFMPASKAGPIFRPTKPQKPVEPPAQKPGS